MAMFSPIYGVCPDHPTTRIDIEQWAGMVEIVLSPYGHNLSNGLPCSLSGSTFGDSNCIMCSYFSYTIFSYISLVNLQHANSSCLFLRKTEVPTQIQAPVHVVI